MTTAEQSVMIYSLTVEGQRPEYYVSAETRDLHAELLFEEHGAMVIQRDFRVPLDAAGIAYVLNFEIAKSGEQR